MAGQRSFVTIVSNDVLSTLLPRPGGAPNAANFRQNLGAPLELPDDASAFEVALVQLNVSGLDPSLSGSIYVFSDVCAATSRLGSETKAYLQSVPANVSGTGTLSFTNEAADLVVWRPVDRQNLSNIELLLESEAGDQLTPCTIVVATFCIRHISLA